MTYRLLSPEENTFSPHSLIAVAEEDGVIVSAMTMHLVPMIDNWQTAPSHRGKVSYRKMLKELEKPFNGEGWMLALARTDLEHIIERLGFRPMEPYRVYKKELS